MKIIPMPEGTGALIARMAADDRKAASAEATREPQAQSARSSVASGSALPGDTGTWSIGDPNNPSRDDAMSGSEEAARNNAAAISRDIERVTAVWHGSECVALYFEGRAYRPC